MLRMIYTPINTPDNVTFSSSSPKSSGDGEAKRTIEISDKTESLETTDTH